jgi:molybdopterin converting factor small subunit
MKLTETFSNDFKQVLVDSQLDDPRPNALILVGGKEISALQGLETEVKDAEEIVLVPMVHGGCRREAL